MLRFCNFKSIAECSAVYNLCRTENVGMHQVEIYHSMIFAIKDCAQTVVHPGGGEEVSDEEIESVHVANSDKETIQ